MIKKSGAAISISESSSQEYGRVWRYVHIKGGGRAVDRAKKLLHIRLERLEPRAVQEGGEEQQHAPNDIDQLVEINDGSELLEYAGSFGSAFPSANGGGPAEFNLNAGYGV